VDESFDFNIDTLHHSKSISTEWRSITSDLLTGDLMIYLGSRSYAEALCFALINFSRTVASSQPIETPLYLLKTRDHSTIKIRKCRAAVPSFMFGCGITARES